MLLKFFVILLSVSGLTLSTPVQDNFEWSKISCESMSTPVSDGRTFDRTPSFCPDLFQLGDSYTSIGYQGKSKGEIFDYIDPQATTAGGPMYGTVLTSNQSTNPQGTQQIDYAVSGAAINNSIINRRVTDLVNQTRLFLADFAPAPADFQWNSSNSVFTFFMGINDLDNSQDFEDQDSLHQELIDSYLISVERIYEAGARNLLFLNVPPTNRSPSGISLGSEQAGKLGKNIGDFNTVLKKRAKDYCESKEDSTCFFHDTHSLFERILEVPLDYGFISSTDYCSAYADQTGTQPSYIQIDPCQPLPSYFWWDDLHVTWPVHKILGQEISKVLQRGVAGLI